MRFANAFWLLIILVLPVVYYFFYKRNRPAKIVFPISIPSSLKMIGWKNPIRILLALKLFSIFIIILALARPQNSFKKVERVVSGVDIMMLLDVSLSMNIEDLADRSRIDIAKDTMEEFIKGRENDRIGFVMFSGEALTLAPPTLDYGLLLKMLRQASIGILKDGTAIGDGLAVAVSHLRSSKAKSRVVILLTDGDNNIGQIDPTTAGELAVGYGIRVYTIAIGREGRVKMPIRTKLPLGNTVTTYQMFENALNPQLLQQIAEKTQGKFYRVTDEKTLESVFKQIDLLEKTDIQTHEKVRYEEIFPKFLKFGLLLIILIGFLEKTWWRFAL